MIMISGWYIVGGIITAIILLIVIIFSLPMLSYWKRYLYCKLNGGGAIIVKWRSKTDDYYKIGKLGKLTISANKRFQKHKTELTIPNDRPVMYRIMGVVHCDVDEQKNAFSTVSFEGVEGFDEETYENIVIRALMNPGQVVNWKLLLIGIGLVAAGVLACLYMINSQGKILEGNQAAVMGEFVKVLAKNITCTPVI